MHSVHSGSIPDTNDNLSTTRSDPNTLAGVAQKIKNETKQKGHCIQQFIVILILLFATILQ